MLACAAAWLWIAAHWEPARPARASRWGAWIVLASCGALACALALGSSGPLVDYHDWNPFAGNYPAATFDWNQQYGPLDPYRPNAKMFEVRSKRAAPVAGDHARRLRRRRLRRVLPAAPPGRHRRGAGRDHNGALHHRRAAQHLAALPRTGHRRNAARQRRAAPRAVLGRRHGQRRGQRAGGRRQLHGHRDRRRRLAQAAAAVPARLSGRAVPDTEFELPDGDVVSLPPAGAGSPTAAGAVERLVDHHGVVSLAPASALAVTAREIAASPYAGVFALARRLARGAPTSYDVAKRIETFCAAATPTASTRRAAPTRSRLPARTPIGYCQQFSGAMALLLRMDGIPARVVAGFQSGAPSGPGSYTVTARDAHEWVEVYFTGVGWVTFDPTPPSPPAWRPIPGTLAADPDAVAAAGDGRRHAALGRRAPPRHRARHDGRPRRPRGGVRAQPCCSCSCSRCSPPARPSPRSCSSRPAARRDAVSELAHALALVGFELAPSMTLTELERRLYLHYPPAAGAYAASLRAAPLRP